MAKPSQPDSVRAMVAAAAEQFIRSSSTEVSARELGQRMRSTFPGVNTNTIRGSLQSFNQSLPAGIARNSSGDYFKP